MIRRSSSVTSFFVLAAFLVVTLSFQSCVRADDAPATQPTPPKLGPEAADDYTITGNETLHVGMLMPGAVIDTYVSVAADGTINPNSAVPVKAVGRNARDIAVALQSAGGEGRVMYVDVYLPAGAAALGNPGDVPDDHKIAAGDLLEISVGDLLGQGTDPVKRTKRVSANGTIALPFIAPLNVSRMTAGDVNAAVNKAYADARLVRNAAVNAKVVETAK